MILHDDRVDPVALPRVTSLVPARVDCPGCGGRGEIVVPGSGRRDPSTGVWDCDTRICGACEGTGTQSAEDAAVCRSCNTETVWLGQGCPLHNDVCTDCRPRGCVECIDDGDWDAEAYYSGRAS